MYLKKILYTEHKITPNLGHITVRGKRKIERLRGEQDLLRVVASSLHSPYLSWGNRTEKWQLD